jgi:hypothetical protein
VLIRIGDGRFASASDDGRIMTWEAASGLTLCAWSAHARPVTALLALDRLHLVSGAANGEIRIWNSYTGELIADCASHTASIKSLCLLPQVLPPLPTSRHGSLSWTTPTHSSFPTTCMRASDDVDPDFGEDTSGVVAGSSGASKQFLSVANDADVCVWDGSGKLFTSFHIASCQESACSVVSHGWLDLYLHVHLYLYLHSCVHLNVFTCMHACMYIVCVLYLCVCLCVFVYVCV